MARFMSSFSMQQDEGLTSAAREGVFSCFLLHDFRALVPLSALRNQVQNGGRGSLD